MNANDYREMTVSELRAKESELAERLFSLRIQKVTGQLEKPHKVKEAKKELARVLTVLNEQSAQSEA